MLEAAKKAGAHLVVKAFVVAAKHLRALAIPVVLISSIGAVYAATDVVLDGGAYQRSRIVFPGNFGPPIGSGALPEAAGKFWVGWAEYDFTVGDTGWRKLEVDAKPSVGATRFQMDPSVDKATPLIAPGEWIWIPAGVHHLRVEQTYWTGFPSIQSLKLKSARAEDGPAFRLVRPTVTSFRSGECPKLAVEVGGLRGPFTLKKRVLSNDGAETTTSISVDPSDAPRHIFTELRCAPGDYRLVLTPDSAVRTFQPQLFDYTVFGIDRVEPKFAKKQLLEEIDLTATSPDFASEATNVEVGAKGSYRLTGSHGFTAFQRRPIAFRDKLPPPSWFAYRLKLPATRRPYILEVEYPDDAARTFVVAIREPDRSPLSLAIETGVIWPLSEKMARREVLFWASSFDMRVVVMNAHDGSKAAVAKMRLYEVEETTRPIKGSDPKSRLRDFRFWDEEGESFQTVVGVRGGGNRVFEVIDRWLREAKFFGAASVSPTASVYGSQMYPSSLLSAFSPQPDRDLLRAMLIDAERYELRVMPQLSPRADEILMGLENPGSRLLVSRTGQMKLFGANQLIERPPYYNALDPSVQDWYVAVVGELADRYQNFSAFEGVDLRIMAWSNAALNNLVSLDWGYDALTVTRFAEENGFSLPVEVTTSGQEESVLAPKRYDFIMQNHRQAWIDWRCRKMYDLFVRLRDRIQSANPRLRLSVTIYSVASSSDRPPTDNELKQAGIDISLLGKLAGVDLVNGLYSYGNREGTEAWLRRSHNQLIDQNFLTFANAARGPSIMMGMQYIETIGEIVPSSALSFPRQAKEPWTSAASNPPGRMYLERFATVLGASDAAMLGDGGNSYVFGSDAMREFLAQFRLLPAIRFHRLVSAPDTVAVWQKGKMFYLVNMTAFSVVVTLHLDSPIKATRTDGSGDLFVHEGIAEMSLRPFDLLVFDSNRDEAIQQVDAQISEHDLARLRSLVERSEEQAWSACQLAVDEECKHLEQSAKAERAALTEHAFWSLLRLIEATPNQTISLSD